MANSKWVFSIFVVFVIALLWAFSVFAVDAMAPQPGDGTSLYRCHVTSYLDLDAKGRTIAGTLRNRIELYNKDDSSALCYFLIYFIEQNKTIVLQKPLFFENRTRDRDLSSTREVKTGTYVSGHGETGLMGITIDAENLTTKSSAQCAFMIKGGLSAKEQLHGFTIRVKKATQAVCDEMGHDLMTVPSTNFPGKLARDADFSSLIIVTPAKPPFADRDHDTVEDTKDNCPDKSNKDQLDNDRDGLGNVCDNYPDDADNNGIPDAEACPNDPSKKMTDQDLDSDDIDDGCDAMIDSDQDGIPDLEDICKYAANQSGDSDIDDDGINNNADAYPCVADKKLDKDNDGVFDGDDGCPDDPQLTHAPCTASIITAPTNSGSNNNPDPALPTTNESAASGGCQLSASSAHHSPVWLSLLLAFYPALLARRVTSRSFK